MKPVSDEDLNRRIYARWSTVPLPPHVAPEVMLKRIENLLEYEMYTKDYGTPEERLRCLIADAYKRWKEREDSSYAARYSRMHNKFEKAKREFIQSKVIEIVNDWYAETGGGMTVKGIRHAINWDKYDLIGLETYAASLAKEGRLSRARSKRSIGGKKPWVYFPAGKA